ncbi:MAG: orotidine-5'-phosphate decarboxylase [Planctomycetota bacterium]
MAGSRTAGSRFIDRLLDRIEAVGAPVCIGLDPVVDRLPADIPGSSDAERVSRFCRDIIDSTAEYAAAFKPQSACFERLGSHGFRALEETLSHARAVGVPVIYDAKRGDIGSTADHYAAAAVAMGVDAITINAYMGPSTVQPYLEAGLGVFILIRTSNRDSGTIQSLQLASGGSVSDAMAAMARSLGAEHRGAAGLSDLGAVVGLTKAAESAHLRERMPEQVFLVPGYGAQGGSPEDLEPLLGSVGLPGRGVIVNASRSVIYAEEPRDAAARMRDDLVQTIR